MDGNTTVDEGSSIRSIVKTLQKYGVCSNDIMPYNENDYTTYPSEEAITEAENYKITSYQRLSSLIDIKNYLYIEEKPIVFGIAVYESFESDDVASTGYIPVPHPNNSDTLIGYHAVTCVGYDDTISYSASNNSISFIKMIINFILSFFGTSNYSLNKNNGCLICQNSWGEEWGDKGFFYLPYEFIDEYAFDFGL